MYELVKVLTGLFYFGGTIVALIISGYALVIIIKLIILAYNYIFKSGK